MKSSRAPTRPQSMRTAPHSRHKDPYGKARIGSWGALGSGAIGAGTERGGQAGPGELLTSNLQAEAVCCYGPGTLNRDRLTRLK